MRVYWVAAFMLLDGLFVDGASTTTLRLLHILHRHGNRNPSSESTIWDSNPYKNESYYSEGYGQLTTAGKVTEYNLGKWYRTRYDTFLGDEWNINYMDLRSTDVNRTKMSAQLVTAAMWIPEGDSIWNEDLLWLPIPYNYVPTSEDSLTTPWSCATFSEAYSAVYNSDEIQTNLAAKYGSMMEIMSEYTGIDVDAYSAAINYADTMKIQTELGFEAEDWVSSVYPDPITALTADYYYMATNNTALRRIMAGALLKKIISDTQSYINGTISPSTRKVFMYSAHDLNVGTLLRSLDLFELSAGPPYGSSVVFEVHEIRSTYGFKLYYYADGTLNSLTLPGCAHFCPFTTFYSLVEDLLPTEDEYCQGS